uniref:Hydroxy-delta-5-steroid dehydrogenase, 3 beta- and steroid delta-isomerase 7 n=1 Tax=Chelonoidis abingdonii TaxID=106734 RepID=A0A8C0QNW5_CHEAB
MCGCSPTAPPQKLLHLSVYLVTGGCGFLGSHLVRMLVERSPNVAEVRVFDLQLDPALGQLGTGEVKVTLILGDISSPTDVGAAVKGADVVIHAASLVDVWGRVPPEKITEVNVHGTKNVIDACIEHGTQYLIYTSSMEVVGPNIKGDPFYRYLGPGRARCFAGTPPEQASVRRSAPPPTLLHRIPSDLRRVSVCYFLPMRPVGAAAHGHQPHCTISKWPPQGLNSQPWRSLPPAGNVAWMHVLVARQMQEAPAVIGGQVYFCYDASPYKSYEDFNMEILASCGFRLLGSQPVVPHWLLRCLALANDLLRRLLRPFFSYAPLLNPYTLAVASTTFTVQTDKAQRHFGYQPLYSWEESRARTVACDLPWPPRAAPGPAAQTPC